MAKKKAVIPVIRKQLKKNKTHGYTYATYSVLSGKRVLETFDNEAEAIRYINETFAEERYTRAEYILSELECELVQKRKEVKALELRLSDSNKRLAKPFVRIRKVYK